MLQLVRRLRSGNQHTVQAEPRREAGTGRFQVDVARARVVGVADQQVHVADDRWLGCQVAHVGRDFILIQLARNPLELDRAICLRGQAFDEPLDLVERQRDRLDLPAIGEANFAERVHQRVRCRRDDDGVGPSEFLRADAVVEQELATELWCQRGGRDCVIERCRHARREGTSRATIRSRTPTPWQAMNCKHNAIASGVPPGFKTHFALLR